MPAGGRTVIVLAVVVSILVSGRGYGQQDGRGPESNRVIDLAGERTTLKTAADKPFAAYLVGPKEAPRGILIIYTAAGLSDPARTWADELGKLGYRAITVDLYDAAAAPHAGPGPTFQSLDQNDANAKYRAALEALHEPGRSLAIFGVCAGGGQALEASLAAPDLVAATVSYYGRPAVDVKRLVHLRSPVLAIYAKGDGSPAEIRAFQAAMHGAGKVLEVQTYDDGPCTASREGDAKHQGARPAWQTARDFLNRYLK